MNNRSLSIFELYEVLQTEYIICELRSIIYPVPKHKKYWKDLAEKKKEKINDISKRNNIPSIFDDKKIKECFYKKVYNEWGLPNFYYPNIKVKEKQEYWDVINYFAINETVKFIDDNEVKISKITFFDKEKMIVEVEIGSKVKLIKTNNVSRIL